MEHTSAPLRHDDVHSWETVPKPGRPNGCAPAKLTDLPTQQNSGVVSGDLEAVGSYMEGRGVAT